MTTGLTPGSPADYVSRNPAIEEYARLITREMGKPISQARQEIAKCAITCRTMSEKGPEWLAPVTVETEASAAGIR